MKMKVLVPKANGNERFTHQIHGGYCHVGLVGATSETRGQSVRGRA